MIPITQTKVVVKNSAGDYVVRGNCYAAAIASILELPISEVPNVETLFHIEGSLWNEVMHAWLTSINYELVSNDDFRIFHEEKYGFLTEEELLKKRQYCENKYYLVSGKSVRGVNHICIYQNGNLVHDPHPTREGIITMDFFEELIKIETH